MKTRKTEYIEWVYKLSQCFHGKSPFPSLILAKQYPKHEIQLKTKGDDHDDTCHMKYVISPDCEVEIDANEKLL